MVKVKPEEIWQEYQKAVSYNQRIGLYEQVKQNENFYIGKQWEGLNAPDLNKPVINVLKRVVSYFISMIVSDDVGASFTPFRADGQAEMEAKILSEQVEEALELADIKAKSREVIRDAAVDGDGCLYFYFDPEAESGQEAKGRIFAEVVPNTNLHFGNPYSDDLQGQPYVLISLRKTVESVQREAEEQGGEPREIRPDSDSNQYDVAGMGQDGLVTVVVKFWKEGGTVRAVKATSSAIVRPAWDTGYKLYPAAVMRWDKVKNSYHGQAAISAMIPNQISINQLFAMGIHSVKSNAFPKIIYDRTKLSAWSNKVGQAIGVVGNPNDAVVSGYRGPDMSGQVMDLIDRLIQKTLEFMGASDAALGNVTPNNTSAIIATQKASSMPLELQKLEFYRFTEEYIRVLMDMIRADYGLREVAIEENGNTVIQAFDLGSLEQANLKLKVDIGSAAYWSEVMQMQTLDNMFARGIIPDAITYIEGIPDQYIRGKGKILDKLRDKMAAAGGAEEAAMAGIAAPGAAEDRPQEAPAVPMDALQAGGA